MRLWIKNLKKNCTSYLYDHNAIMQLFHLFFPDHT